MSVISGRAVKLAILLMLGAEGWSVYCWAPSSAHAHTKAAMEMIDILGVTITEKKGVVG